ncbi:MAG: DNA repair protein RecN [Clostridia bacterium]
MLLQLRIRNIALIDELTVDFTDGMNCLTGETGAGKSIIIDAIQCMLGFRTSKELIKTGRESAYTEGVFYSDDPEVSAFLRDIGIEEEEDHTLILQRELSLSGRNVCRINGRLTAASLLKQLGSLLIDIHGQNENQSLTKTESHSKLLDAYGGTEIANLKIKYETSLKQFRELWRSLEKFSGDPKERERLADLYTYQIDEIANANVYVGEDDELNEKRMILANSEKITEALSASKEIVNGGEFGAASVIDQLSAVKSHLSSIAGYAEEYNELLCRVEEVFYLSEDIAADLRSCMDRVTFDKNELEETEERINIIYKLKRKYGATIEEILDYAENTQKLLDELVSGEETVKKILQELDEKNEELRTFCEDLNFTRVKAAKQLAGQVIAELQSLEMNQAKFYAEIIFNDEKDENGYYNFTGTGLDHVEFLISANPGEPLRPLAKIASGGELSRIMLAIKTILADADHISTLIFDEIDTGISGKAAKSVAQKLKSISRNHQVICVTHHAQIAAAADHNIYIRKISDGATTVTEIETLEYAGKVKEIARLLDGDSDSEITIVHAKELIAKFRSN